MCSIISSIEGYDIAPSDYRASKTVLVFNNEIDITVRTYCDEYGAAVLNKNDIVGLPARVIRAVETIANQFFYYAAFPMSHDYIWTGWYVLSNGMFLYCNEEINPIDWETTGYPDNYGSMCFDIYTDPEKQLLGMQPDISGTWEYSTPAAFQDFMTWIKKVHGVSILYRVQPPITGGY